MASTVIDVNGNVVRDVNINWRDVQTKNVVNNVVKTDYATQRQATVNVK